MTHADAVRLQHSIDNLNQNLVGAMILFGIVGLGILFLIGLYVSWILALLEKKR